MARGYELRQLQAAAARADALCACGHRMGGHRELPRYLPARTIEELAAPRMNPEYEAGACHCEDAGCECIVRLT